jgi:hypothetical protein
VIHLIYISVFLLIICYCFILFRIFLICYLYIRYINNFYNNHKRLFMYQCLKYALFRFIFYQMLGFICSVFYILCNFVIMDRYKNQYIMGFLMGYILLIILVKKKLHFMFYKTENCEL